MTTKAKKANRIIWLVIAILIVIFLFRLDNPFLQAQVAVQGPDEKSTTLKIEVIDNIGSMILDAELIPSLDTIDEKEVPIKDRYFEMPTDLIEKNRPPDGEDVLVKKHLRISPEDFDRIKDENTTAEDVKKIIIDAIIAYYGSSYDKYEISVMPEKRPLPQGKETAEKEPPSKGKKTADELVDDLIDLTPPKIDQPATGPLGPPKKPGVLLPPKKDQPATGPLGDPTPKRPILPIKPKIGFTRKAVLYVDDALFDFIKKDFLEIKMPWGNYMDLYRDNNGVTAEELKLMQPIYAVVRAKSISDKQKMKLYEAAMKKYREELKKYEGTIEFIVDPLGSGQSIIDSMNPLQKNKK